MKTGKIRVFVSAALALAVIFTLIPLSQADAAGDKTVTEKMDKYVSFLDSYGNAYWNANLRSKKDQQKLKDAVDRGDFSYGLTGNACTYTGTHDNAHGCTSNVFGGGAQCHGFAKYFAYYLFGSYPTKASGTGITAGYKDDSNWTYYKKSLGTGECPELQPGDFIRYYNVGASHSAIVYSVSGNTITVIQGNGGNIGKCGITKYALSKTYSQFKSYYDSNNAYVCRNNSMITDDDTPEPPTAPEINVYTDAVTELTETGVRLNGHFTASEKVHITEHGAYLGTSPDSMTRVATDYVDYNKSKLTMFYRTGKYYGALTPGTTYYYQQYMVIGDDEYQGDILSFTTLGTAPGGRTDTDSGSIGNDDLSYGVIHGTAGNLSIRSGPGTSYEKLGRIPEGATCAVDLSRTSGSWYWVTYNGVSGYASKNYITVSQPQDENIRRGVIHGTAGNLSIRSGPGTSYEKLGRIPEGATCTVDLSRTSGSWYWVTYNGVSGYASGKYIELQG